jgi:error-prone DNA polymerase
MEQHRDRLVSRMKKKGIKQEFAEAIYKQICGFGEYGFPESHAASFALISYVGSYLRAHYPAIFTCGLLNAQPMGFYSAATIVGDARRRGVEVRPIDAVYSSWDCTLEGEALRMGLRYVKSLREKIGTAIMRAREERAFDSIDDLSTRAGLDAGSLAALAEAGACDSLGDDRRQALWRAHSTGRSAPVPLSVDEGDAPEFPTLSRFEEIGWDHTRSAHSTRGHPLEELRGELAAQGLPDARSVAAMPDGRRVRYAGLVICRQRPGTASGVTFLTLEDETGFVNVVVWRKVFEKHALVLKTTSFLGIEGKLQVEGGVTHLVADALWKPSVEIMPVAVESHDFH